MLNRNSLYYVCFKLVLVLNLINFLITILYVLDKILYKKAKKED